MLRAAGEPHDHQAGHLLQPRGLGLHALPGPGHLPQQVRGGAGGEPYLPFHPPKLQRLPGRKLSYCDLCEGGSFSVAIFAREEDFQMRSLRGRKISNSIFAREEAFLLRSLRGRKLSYCDLCELGRKLFYCDLLEGGRKLFYCDLCEGGSFSIAIF